MLRPGQTIYDRRSAITVEAMMRPALVLRLVLVGALGVGVNQRVILDLRNERVMDAALAENLRRRSGLGTAHLLGRERILAGARYELAAHLAAGDGPSADHRRHPGRPGQLRLHGRAAVGEP